MLSLDEPWFIAKDVCDILGFANPSMALKSLDYDEVAKFNLGGQAGVVNLISESGLYTLVMRSRKSAAKKFQQWVTREVLPSIRKHGAYMSPAKLVELIQNPDSITTLLETLRDEQIKNGRLQKEVDTLKPKADKTDLYMDSDGLTNLAKGFTGKTI